MILQFYDSVVEGLELTLDTLLQKMLEAVLDNRKVHPKIIYCLFCKLFIHGKSGLLRSDEGCITRVLIAEPFCFFCKVLSRTVSNQQRLQHGLLFSAVSLETIALH